MPVGVGVDVSVRRGLDVVVLDEHRRLVEAPLARQTPVDLEGLLRRLRPDVVALDSPPAWGVRGNSRAAERELIALGLPCFCTPSDPALRDHPFYGWMFAGHAAFAAAARAGYSCFTGIGDGRGRALEVFPHGAAGAEVDRLRTQDAVDAALAAVVAVIVAGDGPWFWLGETDEGCVVLPGHRPAGPYPRS